MIAEPIETTFEACGEIARDILTAERDCSLCGGEGLIEEADAACGACHGSGRVLVYGPNVRELATGFLAYGVETRPGA